MSRKNLLNDIKKIKKSLQKDDISLTIIDELKRRVEELDDSFFPESKKTKKEDLRGTFELDFKFKEERIDFALFSDGGCRGNPGPGAHASMGQDKKGEILFEMTGVEMLTTNNQMELMGAITALKSLREYAPKFMRGESFQGSVWLYTDSKYVVEGVESWMAGWKKKNWKKSDGSPVMNLDYWLEMDSLVNKFESLKFIWVKGHSGHPQNEHCDQMLNQALDEIL